MPSASEYWFKFAKNDLRDAEILFKNKSYQGTVWHCHQALEKHLKGTIAKQGRTVRKTHDLPTLLKDSGQKLSKTNKLLKLTKETIKWLNFHNDKPKK